jgi:hypothetical protein
MSIKYTRPFHAFTETDPAAQPPLWQPMGRSLCQHSPKVPADGFWAATSYRRRRNIRFCCTLSSACVKGLTVNHSHGRTSVAGF